MSNKGVPGLRILCIFQFATNDENVNLGVYPESDPENIACPSLSTVKCPFRRLDIIRLQKSTMKSSWGGGGCRRGLSSPRTIRLQICTVSYLAINIVLKVIVLQFCCLTVVSPVLSLCYLSCWVFQLLRFEDFLC